VLSLRVYADIATFPFVLALVLVLAFAPPGRIEIDEFTSFFTLDHTAHSHSFKPRYYSNPFSIFLLRRGFSLAYISPPVFSSSRFDSGFPFHFSLFNFTFSLLCIYDTVHAASFPCSFFCLSLRFELIIMSEGHCFTSRFVSCNILFPSTRFSHLLSSRIRF